MWWQLEAQKNLGHKKEKGEEGNNVYVVMIIMIMITMIEIRKKFFRLVTSVGQRKNSESPKTFVWRVFVPRSWTDCENVDASWTLYEFFPTPSKHIVIKHLDILCSEYLDNLQVQM